MRMNWGNGILVTFILFCSFIVAVVWKTFQQDVNLVSEQYYQEELDYQQRIDAIRNAKNLPEEVMFSHLGERVTIKLPETSFVEGSLHFYRPDNSKLDVKIPITALDSEYSVASLTPGRYTAKITWSDNQKTYFDEKDLFIQ